MADSSIKWTDEQTLQLIQLRSENEHLFTGQRNTLVNGYDEIIKKMGLEGKVTAKQAAKKWENLKKKYKDLMSSVADQWLFFTAMHTAVCQKSSAQPLHVVSSCVSGDRATSPIPASDITDDMKDPGDYGVWGATAVTGDLGTDDGAPQNQVTFTGPGGEKRKRNSLLDYLKRESDREEKRFKEAEARETARHEENQRQMNRLLSAFERMVDKM